MSPEEMRPKQHTREIDVTAEFAGLAHSSSVNGENFDTTLLVWKADFDVNLKSK